jgi:undecaprenyl pyrophosphate synthase
MNNKEIKNLRKLLPNNYADILYKKYRKENRKYSKSTIYKVLHGERINQRIMGDLIVLAEKQQQFLKRLAKFEKRNEKAPNNIHSGKGNRRTLPNVLSKIFKG